MLKKITLSCFVFLFSLTCFAGTDPGDSLVYFSEINYDNDLEKEAFHKYFINREDNYFDLFNIAGSGIDSNSLSKSKNDYNKMVAAIKEGRYNKTVKESKKVQAIYKEVHNRFLKKYELKNHFNEIFTNGNFNCVSGSALFALVFSELNIPYDIIEAPSHVYLVSFPGSFQVLVETTDPVKGYYSFDQNFKASYVSYLRENKLISPEEYNAENINSIFDKYYFSETRIGLRELVGIQYSNDALYHFDKKDYEKAHRQLEKSYLFYPSPRTAYLMVLTSAYILEESDYSNADHIYYSVKLSRFGKYGISSKDISNEFLRITQEVLINKSDASGYDALYKVLSTGIKNDTVMNEVDFIYNYERGRILFNQGQINQGIKYVEKAYEIKPGNADAQSLFIAAISQKLKYSTDMEEVIRQLENYLQKHNALDKNNLFCAMLCHGYLLSSSQNYSNNNLTGGDKYRVIFEEFFESKKEIILDGNIIGNTYSLASSAYFRKGNYSKTKYLLKKGLEYAPDNFELKRRMEMVK